MLLLIPVAILSGCATNAIDNIKKPEAIKIPPPQISMSDRMAIPLVIPDIKKKVVKIEKKEKLYDFNFSGPVVEALRTFASLKKVNIVISKDLSGDTEVSLKKVSLQEALSAILMSVDAAWEKKGNIIYVNTQIEKTFEFPYIDVKRSFSSGSSSGSNGSSGSGSSSGNSESNTITQTQEVDVFDSLSTILNGMKSKGGVVLIDPVSGTIYVKDKVSVVRAIGNYLKSTETIMNRQADLEIEIIEYTNTSGHKQNINWQNILVGGSGTAITGNIGAAIAGVIGANSNLAGATGANSSSLASLNFKQSKNRRFNAIIDILEKTGKVKVISKPRMRIMNKQPGVIRVGSNIPVFSATKETTTSGNIITTESTSNISVGLEIGVVPQISNNTITLSLSPSMSGIVNNVTSPLGSTLPVTDVKKADTTIKLNDGETAVIGGLNQVTNRASEQYLPGTKRTIFGTLTGGDSFSNENKQLIILITAKIINSN